MMEHIENKLDTGLDRSIGAVIGWAKAYLQVEQKKTDFKPDTDVDTVPSAVQLYISIYWIQVIIYIYPQACLTVVQTIQPIIDQIKKCVDGENVQATLTEFGTRLHRVIYEHLQQMQFNTAGAMCAICDVNEYRKCIRSLNSPLATQLFDILHALCNLLLVKPKNLQEVCTGETLVREFLIDFLKEYYFIDD